MEAYRRFQEKDVTVSTSYDSILTGTNLGKAVVSADLTSTGTTSGLADDAVSNFLGVFEWVQGPRTLIRIAAQDMRHMSARTRGGYDDYQSQTAAGAQLYRASLDLDALQPNAVIGTNDNVPINMRGKFGALSDFGSGGISAMAGTLRPSAISSPVEPSGFHLRPNVFQRTIDISTDSRDIQDRIPIEADTVIAGISIRTMDATSNTRVDGLVKNLRLEVFSGNRTTELFDVSWGAARHADSHASGFSQADEALSNGFVFIPTQSRLRGFRENIGFQKGNGLVLHLDTLSAAETNYTDVTPQAGDTAIVTVYAFEPVNSAPTQATAEQSTLSVNPDRTNARTRRRTKRAR